MCVEKTPWEQTVDFHGHTCPEIALGYRAAQIAARELGIRPASNSELIIVAECGSCALDAFQVMNQVTLGNGTLQVEGNGKHVYHFQYSGTDQILRLSIKTAILSEASQVHLIDSPLAKQTKTLEVIQLILSCQEDDFCLLSTYSGTLTRSFGLATSWLTCAKCQDAVMEEYAVYKNELVYCVSCAR